jgi:hypothetical protein
MRACVTRYYSQGQLVRQVQHVVTKAFHVGQVGVGNVQLFVLGFILHKAVVGSGQGGISAHKSSGVWGKIGASAGVKSAPLSQREAAAPRRQWLFSQLKLGVFSPVTSGLSATLPIPLCQLQRHQLCIANCRGLALTPEAAHLALII